MNNMIITKDRIGYVITDGRAIRRYCNYTRLEAIREFKQWAKYQTKPVVRKTGL